MDKMNKLVIYLIALISGVIGVFAFSPFDYWGLAYVSLGGLLFVAKNAKKSTALLATFLWSMGFFCFGVYRFSLVTIWLYPNRQSVLRYRADLWCHRDDILYRLGKCGHF